MSASRLYRLVSAVLCASFAVVGALFLLAPGAVLALFDRWSAALGLAVSGGAPGELFVVLAGAYMVLVTLLAWAMARAPEDPVPARLLVQAKWASALLSFAVFFLRQQQLVLLVNGVVDGAIGALVLLLLRAQVQRASERLP